MIFAGRGLIIGSGVSGRGAAYALDKLGVASTVTATEFLPPNMSGYDFAIVSPGVKHTHPIYKYARIHDLPVFGEIGLAATVNTKPVIGVTGTNGKTTTVEMLGSIYAAAGTKAVVCGNIGRSFAAAAADGGYDRAVVELSSFQLLQSSPLKTHIACITNIAEDHLDYHGSMLEYRHAKLRIADRQTKDDYLIVPTKFNLVGMSGNPTLLYNGKDCYEKEGKLYVMGAPIMRTCELAAVGRHNVENALNAALAAYVDGVKPEAIAEGLAKFKPDSHRISLVGEYDGTAFYNDSKGTNIAATLAAVDCMKGSVALIVGGSDKGYDYDNLFRGLPGNVRAVLVVGANCAKILDCAARMGYNRIVPCMDLSEAVSVATAGGFDNVLFSPASASFDRYKNYKERGEAFEREVKKLFGSV